MSDDVHYQGMSGCALVQTDQLLRALQNLDMAFRARAMTLIYAPTGVGKTVVGLTAMEVYGKDECCRVKCPPEPNPRTIANLIASAVTGYEHDETRSRAGGVFVKTMTEHRKLVILDEAQWLSLRCLHFMRWAHDEVPGGFPLLFIGGPRLKEQFWRDPQLRRRILNPTPMRPLSKAKLVGTIRQWHQLYAEAPDELILEMNDKACKSNFGNWAKVTYVASELCKIKKVATITPNIAFAAIRRQNGWLT